MKIKFSNEQKDFLKQFEFPFDLDGELTDDELLEIDDYVSEKLMDEGINDDDEMNETGIICESIMEMLGA